ncbi:MAG: hypothetical protein LBV16_06850 [Elusimicrobiota bacterium]|jgi:hypothetical protein|nr:hypothetical protein [Elusimicrobiota bacterium]
MKQPHKLPAVLTLLFILIFASAAGYYFSRSFALMSFSLFIFTCALDILIEFSKEFDLNISITASSEFKGAQLKAVILNSAAAIFFSIIIIAKLLNKLGAPYSFNALLAAKFAIAAAIVFLICAVILRKGYKADFKKCLCYILLAILIAAGSIIIEKTQNFVWDLYLSFAIAALILIQTIFLIIKTINSRSHCRTFPKSHGNDID